MSQSLEILKRKRKSTAHIRIFFSGDIPAMPTAGCKWTKEPLWDLDLDKESKHNRVARHTQALLICSGCPVKAECEQWAISNEMMGVWGGRIFSPEWHKYPRCSICDHALAFTMNAVRQRRLGYVLPHPASDEVCETCGDVVGLQRPTEAPEPEFDWESETG